MLKAKIKRVMDETQQVKQEIADTLTAQAPPAKCRCFTIMFSEIEDSILSAAYYDTGHQLRQLANYATESADRSLVTITNAFRAIVDYGRSAAITGITVFNQKTRSVLQDL